MVDDKIFSKRLNSAMIENNMKQIDLCKKTGISKSAMSQYLSNSFVPKNDKIYLLSQALGVNPAWLMGYDVERYLLKLENAPREPLKNNDENELLTYYRQCSIEDKEELLMIAKHKSQKNVSQEKNSNIA